MNVFSEVFNSVNKRMNPKTSNSIVILGSFPTLIILLSPDVLIIYLYRDALNAKCCFINNLSVNEYKIHLMVPKPLECVMISFQL